VFRGVGLLFVEHIIGVGNSILKRGLTANALMMVLYLQVFQLSGLLAIHHHHYFPWLVLMTVL
jgi:hypothetical protein